jgi:hypothetical protein
VHGWQFAASRPPQDRLGAQPELFGDRARREQTVGHSGTGLPTPTNVNRARPSCAASRYCDPTQRPGCSVLHPQAQLGGSKTISLALTAISSLVRSRPRIFRPR